MSADTHRALVLNADYQPLSYFPLSTVGWHDAIRQVVKGVVSVVANYDRIVRSPSIEMPLPSVVALRSYQPPPKHVAFTRFNVFLRDHFRCQYCGHRFRTEDLTFDHVTPRARGGQTTWENVCAACEPCNAKKDDKVGHPIRMPYKPAAGQLMAIQRKFQPNYLHETWVDWLYWSTELESP